MEKSIDFVDESCFVGMITSQTYMYLGTFKKCRKNVLNAIAPPEVLCDTGYGVLDGAKVITAVAVLRKQSRPDTSRPCIAFRMFNETEDEKEATLVGAIESISRGQVHLKSYLTSISIFVLLPSSVYSYWVPSTISELFSTLSSAGPGRRQEARMRPRSRMQRRTYRRVTTLGLSDSSGRSI